MTQALAQELLDLHLTRRVPRRKQLVKGLNLQSCYMFQFPYIYEQYDVMSTALSAYGCLATASNFQAAPRTMTLPLCKSVLELPLEKAAQSDVLWFLNKTLEEGFGKAITLSSKNAMCAFSHFSYDCSQQTKTNPDVTATSILDGACSLFNSLLYKYMLIGPCPLDPDVPYCQPVAFHDWFMSLESKVFRGVEGSAQEAQQLHTYANLLMSASALLRAKPANEVSRELCDGLLDKTSNFVEEIGKLGAVLIIGMRKSYSTHWAHELLHSLVWAPANFLELSSSVVSIWEWVAAASPTLKLRLFQEISSLWKFLLYRGGVVVPGALHMTSVESKPVSPLFHSAQALRLSSLRQTGESLGSLQAKILLTDTHFLAVKQEHILTMQRSLLQFFSREFHPCLVRNFKAAQQIIKVIQDTICCPADALASSSVLGLEIVMMLLSLGFAATKNSRSDCEAAVCRFALEYFSDLPQWLTIDRRDLLEQVLGLMEAIEMVGPMQTLSMTRSRDVEVLPTKLRINFGRLDLACKELYSVKPFSLIGQARYEPTRASFETRDHAELLKLILMDEIERLKSWNDPVNPGLRGIPKK